jgi:hypothetical protein
MLFECLMSSLLYSVRDIIYKKSELTKNQKSVLTNKKKLITKSHVPLFSLQNVEMQEDDKFLHKYYNIID